MDYYLEEQIWRKWKSVEEAKRMGIEIARISKIDGTDVVYLYSTPNSRIGLINSDKIITNPIFTPSCRFIGNNLLIIDEWGIFPNYNKGVIVDIDTGIILPITNFAAYSIAGDSVYVRNDHRVQEGNWYCFDTNTRELTYIGEKVS